ncbi:MAG: PKD domain-containing protein, partial [Bacteroidales bacterium]|nr:PKD domain-containing protein [Bacteroidales bacterium]
MIWSNPIANFEPVPNQGCVNTTCFSFTNTTLPGHWGSSCIDTTHFQWDFGNGNTSTLSTPPCQYYNTTGNYTISLTTQNQCGSSSTSKVISVQDIPVAIASPDQNDGCVPFEVSFSNTSSGIGIQYEWSILPATGWAFISGNAQSQNPVIRFTNPGTYTVTLNVSNACESDDISFTILAKDTPSINIPVIADNCVDFIYNGNVIYNTNGSPVTSYHWSVNPPNGWNFVLPSTADSANPDIRFSAPGIYQITVQATNECGTDSQTSNIFDIVTQEPVDAGNDTTVCQYSDSFQLTGDPDGGTWSGINVTPPALFTPDSAGVFMLIYSRGTGSCLSKDSLQISVIPAPVVDAGNDRSLCKDDGPVTLTGVPGGGIWDGEGIIDNANGLFDPSVSGTGSFFIYYTVDDSNTGCTNTDSLVIDVRPVPIILFGYELPACVGEFVQFTNQCLYAESY